MKIRSIFLALAILSVGTWAQAQGRLNVQANDSMAFVLYVNDVKANNIPVTDITLPSVSSGKINLKAEFVFHPEITCASTVNLKDSFFSSFEIAQVKGSWKFSLSSENAIARPAVMPQNSTSTSTSNTPTSITPETIVMAPEAMYTGDVGCEGLCSDSDFRIFTDQLKGAIFESKKLESMKSFVSTHCISVDQLRFLMAQLELEDNRFKLLEAGLNQIYDRDFLKTVEEDFFLEKNKQRVKALING